MPNLIVSAVSTFDNKGLKKGKKEISTFEKQVKSFAKVFAAAFSVNALKNYSKKAVQAFAADEKAAKSLEVQLKNTGYQFSAPGVELYIANLQKTTGVLDDQLRPAFQQLLTVTGSISTSQDALNTALNVSAATGRSLTQVTTALSRAYAGNTTGLSRLGAGLDKTLLASGDMNKIMAELNKKFTGQSAARLTTYAGKMDLLAVAAADAQEIIGKGILDALTLLGDDKSIDNLTTGMQNFATAISEVVVGLGQVGSKLKDLGNLPGGGSIFDVRNIPVIGAYIGGLRQIGRNAMPQKDRGGQERTATRIAAQERKLEAKAIKNSVALRKAETDALKKKTAVDQLRDKFDLERIGLEAARNGAIDAETKLRIDAKIAILDNNEALAKKLLAEMNGVKATEELTKALYAVAGAAMDSALKFKQINPLAGTYYGETGRDLPFTSPSAPTGLTPSIPNPLAGTYYGETGRDLPSNLRITVDTAQTGDRFAQLIAESIQVAQRTGFSTTAAGSLPV